MADFQWTLNSLTFGAGTYYEIVSLQGLGAQPPATNDLKLLTNGVYPARDVAPPKVLTFKVEIWGTPGSDLAGKISAWATAWKVGVNTDTALTYQFQGLSDTRLINGRSRGWDFTLDQPATMGSVKVAAQFFSPDGIIRDHLGNPVDF